MRRRLMIAGALTACWLAAGSLGAAVIKGRVVDSEGRPVAGAEIRVWRKTRAVGRVVVRPSELVSFDGKESLVADDAGRFQTPDVFNATMRVRLTAQAARMLAGRSGWFLPQHQARLFLVRMLGLQGSDYWRHAGFWEPEE